MRRVVAQVAAAKPFGFDHVLALHAVAQSTLGRARRRIVALPAA
jgi:hypothetical protein